MSVSVSCGACEWLEGLTRGSESFTGCGASLAAMMEGGCQMQTRCLLTRNATWSSDRPVSVRPIRWAGKG